MNYKQTLSYIYGLERFGIKLGLENITSLLSYVGNPHLKFKSIHIAGTNGKGSVASMLESILCEAGYKTGLFTSPHLVDFRERVRVCGKKIEKDFILSFVENVKSEIDKNKYTFFEVNTALAFSYFAEKKVDLAMVETGLGGRLDSTNVINPEIAVITKISFDHTEHLGKTLLQIASEKGGIIKKGVPTIVMDGKYEILEVFESLCSEKNSLFIPIGNSCKWEIEKSTFSGSVFSLFLDSKEFKNLKINLAGEHQVLNAVTSVCACEQIEKKGWNITEEAIRKGLNKIDWKGRLEVLRKKPLVIIDVAHNPEGIKVLVRSLKKLIPDKKMIFIFGVVEGKDYPKMLKTLSGYADFIILTQPSYHKALDVALLEKEIRRIHRIKKHKVTSKGFIEYAVISKIEDAYKFALSKVSLKDAICVTGSHFVVGELLEILEGKRKKLR